MRVKCLNLSIRFFFFQAKREETKEKPGIDAFHDNTEINIKFSQTSVHRRHHYVIVLSSCVISGCTVIIIQSVQRPESGCLTYLSV